MSGEEAKNKAGLLSLTQTTDIKQSLRTLVVPLINYLFCCFVSSYRSVHGSRFLSQRFPLCTATSALHHVAACSQSNCDRILITHIFELCSVFADELCNVADATTATATASNSDTKKGVKHIKITSRQSLITHWLRLWHKIVIDAVLRITVCRVLLSLSRSKEHRREKRKTERMKKKKKKRSGK